jgi:hypothetical protein
MITCIHLPFLYKKRPHLPQQQYCLLFNSRPLYFNSKTTFYCSLLILLVSFLIPRSAQGYCCLLSLSRHILQINQQIVV